ATDGAGVSLEGLVESVIRPAHRLTDRAAKAVKLGHAQEAVLTRARQVLERLDQNIEQPTEDHRPVGFEFVPDFRIPLALLARDGRKRERQGALGQVTPTNNIFDTVNNHRATDVDNDQS